jgi:hypothetical protein
MYCQVLWYLLWVQPQYFLELLCLQVAQLVLVTNYQALPILACSLVLVCPL